MSWFSRGALVILGLAVLLAGCNGLNPTTGSGEPGAPAVGSPAPETEGVDADGQHFSLNDYRGKVVMLSYWGSFCGPCRALFPHERALVERYQGKPFVLLGVNVDPKTSASRQLQKDGSVTWRCFQDEGYEIAAAYGVRAIPEVFLIDPHGVVQYVWQGAGTDKLDRKIEELVKDAEVGR
jgi:peroxiredoxin